MRRLFLYIRQCFCKHDFIVEEEYVEENIEGLTKTTKTGPKVYMRCKNCGYHMSHWKY